MANYKILSKFHTEGDVEIAELILPEGFKDNEFSGRPINPVGDITASLKKGKGNYPDFLIGGTALLVISNKLKKLLEETIGSSTIEFFDVEIKNSQAGQKYYLLNILENINCFDWKNSEYETFPDFIIEELPHLKGRPDTISKLVLNQNKIGERQLFRMVESPIQVFISPELIDILIANNITGYKLMPIEDFKK